MTTSMQENGMHEQSGDPVFFSHMLCSVILFSGIV